MKEQAPSGMSGMPIDRAVQINGLLLDAWMIREGIGEGRAPGFLGVSLEDCFQAMRTIRDIGPTRNADGSQTYRCTVDESVIARLFAWAALREQMT